MFIENGYGKTIHIRIEDYILMTDEEWQEIVASGHGEYIEDPFVDFTGIRTEKVISIEEIELEEVEEEEIDDEIDNISEEYE